MRLESLIGTWAGIAKNNNGWEMEITISIPSSFEVGSILGTYNIPQIPCTGKFRILDIQSNKLELKAEDQQGECGKADSDSLESLSDGTLLYVSRGKGWEAKGILQRKI
ncbi:MAG: hypothetical protein JNM46_04640 [Anaerolineales bacterium]|nr:hypothetical protein [Anaerolineales bacterium]